MFTDMFGQLFTYNPADFDEETREKMASILKARAEYLHASAEVLELRCRAWAGEAGIEDLAELKASNLAKLRQDYAERMQNLFVDAVNMEGLVALLPMVAGGVLQNFKIPLPVLLEAAGLDLDYLQIAVRGLKGLFED